MLLNSSSQVAESAVTPASPPNWAFKFCTTSNALLSELLTSKQMQKDQEHKDTHQCIDPPLYTQSKPGGCADCIISHPRIIGPTSADGMRLHLGCQFQTLRACCVLGLPFDPSSSRRWGASTERLRLSVTVSAADNTCMPKISFHPSGRAAVLRRSDTNSGSFGRRTRINSR